MSHVIEKTGLSSQFTLADIDENKPMFEQKIREIEAQVKVEEAKMTNIETHHPFVKKMSEQDLFTAHMYQECKAIVVVGRKKIQDIQNRLNYDAKEKIEIMKQIPELAVAIAQEEHKNKKESKPEVVASPYPPKKEGE